MREISMKVDIHTGIAQPRLHFVHRVDSEESVLNCPVADNRRLNFCCVDVLERRKAIPDDARREQGAMAKGKQGQCAPPMQ